MREITSFFGKEKLFDGTYKCVTLVTLTFLDVTDFEDVDLGVRFGGLS
jgi:hypothetical protein